MHGFLKLKPRESAGGLIPGLHSPGPSGRVAIRQACRAASPDRARVRPLLPAACEIPQVLDRRADPAGAYVEIFNLSRRWGHVGIGQEEDHVRLHCHRTAEGWTYGLPEVIGRAAVQRAPHHLAEYLEETAGMVNSWYHAGNPSRNPALAVLVDDPELRSARLALVGAVRIVLANGLRVLGLTRAEVSVLLLGELALEIALAIPLGFLAGYWLAALLLALMPIEGMEFPLVIFPSTYAYAGAVVAAAGVASALVVRNRIDNLDLVAVLKTRE